MHLSQHGLPFGSGRATHGTTWASCHVKSCLRRHGIAARTYNSFILFKTFSTLCSLAAANVGFKTKHARHHGNCSVAASAVQGCKTSRGQNDTEKGRIVDEPLAALHLAFLVDNKNLGGPLAMAFPVPDGWRRRREENHQMEQMAQKTRPPTLDT